MLKEDFTQESSFCYYLHPQSFPSSAEHKRYLEEKLDTDLHSMKNILTCLGEVSLFTCTDLVSVFLWVYVDV